MAVSHRVTITPEPETDTTHVQLSLREKFRIRLAKGPTFNKHTKVRSILFFVFTTASLMYTSLGVLIPHSYSDYDLWIQYYAKILTCFLFANGVANWLCFHLYDTSFKQTKDRPEYDVGALFNNNPDHFVGRLGTLDDVDLVPSDEWSSWKHCVTCQKQVPPRAHHCKYCKTCILKRDHHCFVIGNCVGFKNQRYFVVLLFYLSVICLGGGYLTWVYLYDNHKPSDSFYDYILPMTFFRLVFGNVDVTTFFHVYHAYVLIPLGLTSALYFVSQLVLVAEGVTPYELENMTVRCTRTIKENFRDVFGDFWGINFLFPAQLIFRQREDGRSWDGIKMIKKIRPS